MILVIKMNNQQTLTGKLALKQTQFYKCIVLRCQRFGDVTKNKLE